MEVCFSGKAIAVRKERLRVTEGRYDDVQYYYVL